MLLFGGQRKNIFTNTDMYPRNKQENDEYSFETLSPFPILSALQMGRGPGRQCPQNCLIENGETLCNSTKIQLSVSALPPNQFCRPHAARKGRVIMMACRKFRDGRVLDCTVSQNAKLAEKLVAELAQLAAKLVQPAAQYPQKKKATAALALGDWILAPLSRWNRATHRVHRNALCRGDSDKRRRSLLQE